MPSLAPALALVPAITTQQLKLILETVEQISTEFFFLIIIKIMEDFVTEMTFYIVLMIFAYKCFALFNAHLTAKRMGDQMGYAWPYSKHERRRLYQVFEKGMAVENRSLHGEHGPSAGAVPHDRWTNPPADQNGKRSDRSS
jgi:hypothetical protein